MKKIFLILVTVIVICPLFASCFGNSPYSSAKYEGYRGVAFEDGIDDYIESNIEADDEIEGLEYDVESGWTESWGYFLAEEDIKPGEIEVTYYIKMEITFLEKTENTEYHFHMAYNEETNTLRAMGSTSVKNGSRTYGSAEETDALIRKALSAR